MQNKAFSMEDLFAFLNAGVSAFHSTAAAAAILEAEGYRNCPESAAWHLVPGGKYYTTRNGSAILAWRMPKGPLTGWHAAASHSDSPTWRIKTLDGADHGFARAEVEGYGGMLMSTWFDRPLSVAGRLLVRTADGVESRLVHPERALACIPNLCIHFNREANKGTPCNMAVDMLPLFCEQGEEKNQFMQLIADEAGVQVEDILDTDLFLYDRMKGTTLGFHGEFIASGRLDDLQCAFASLKGFLAAELKQSIAVHCVYDNEEVGSGTKQGAASTFLKDTLQRISRAMGRSEEQYLMSIASSFMVSADNAHAVHPNHAEKADPTNRPYMNRGIVIKYSANQKYTTDGVSGAVMRAICKKAEVPYQTFTNRSDMLGGSTLGNISQAQVALNTVDIGLPQLAMHSPYETAGARDTAYLIEAARVLFSSSFEGNGDGNYRLIF